MQKRYITSLLLLAATAGLQAKAENKSKAPEQSAQKAEQNCPIHKFIETSSGLRYQVIQEGSGKSPSLGQYVSVHYTGWLNNNDKPGKKFDSSVDRKQKFQFILGIGQVIRGWDEMVSLMKAGQKVRVYLPAKLAYGTRGAGAAIPPNSDLIFDIELL